MRRMLQHFDLDPTLSLDFVLCKADADSSAFARVLGRGSGSQFLGRRKKGGGFFITHFATKKNPPPFSAGPETELVGQIVAAQFWG